MDVTSFRDAFRDDYRQPEHLLNLVARQDRAGFALLLGAGASATSSVKTAMEMVDEWREVLFASSLCEHTFTEWLERQGWFNRDDEYMVLFEKVYDEPAQRRAYIEAAVAKAKPSWGYAYLASLLAKRKFEVVFTTNFDDLVNEACYSFVDRLRPLVCTHDSAVQSVRLLSSRPRILKLHGDFLFDSLKNTMSELRSLEENMRDKFSEFSRELGLIVLGYSGRDQSVMDLLDVLVRDPRCFPNGVYWCVQRGSEPSDRVRQLIRQDGVYWIEIVGFDEFMADVAQATGVDLPEGVSRPWDFAFSRTQHLLHSQNHSPLLRSVVESIHASHRKVSKILVENGLLRRERDIREILEISDAHSCWHSGSQEEAEKRLRQMMKSGTQDAWSHLLELLLKEEGRREDVIHLLKDPHSSSADECHKSWAALLVNDPDLALEFAEKALAENETRGEARINRAIAMLMLGRNKELEEDIAFLTSEERLEHFRAAGFALLGDLPATVRHLQRAFVSKQYSAKAAFSDVVFRPYWRNSEFVDRISHFLDGEPRFPYRKSCPPSDAEVALSKAVE